ncbi:MAG: tRNA pseudouridine(38-40) synthase TruA [Roseburia sp.]|nr:tRNA pseudouridine(38-40) synthase TruA [Roseburia sp.]
MRNFKIILQYEGTRYQGWQRQDSTGNTIQGKLEAILGKMTGLETVQVDGSGRTDAGVHAYGQVANFKLDTDKTAAEVMAYINRYLPEDIGVISAEEVPERFHSRLHAKGKTYCYRIWNSAQRCVFERRYVYEYPQPLDIAAMRRAAKLLTGTHDFKAFTSAKKGRKPTVRTIEALQIEAFPIEAFQTEPDGGQEIRLTYRGDGFLYHMVRIITGTLIEVGSGMRRPEEAAEILASGARERAGMLAPAKGLALMEVRY